MIKQLLNSILLLLILASFGSPTIASAQEEKEEITRILFVFDASNSMNAIWQKRSKLEVAKKCSGHFILLHLTRWKFLAIVFAQVCDFRMCGIDKSHQQDS